MVVIKWLASCFTARRQLNSRRRFHESVDNVANCRFRRPLNNACDNITSRRARATTLNCRATVCHHAAADDIPNIAYILLNHQFFFNLWPCTISYSMFWRALILIPAAENIHCNTGLMIIPVSFAQNIETATFSWPDQLIDNLNIFS